MDGTKKELGIIGEAAAAKAYEDEGYTVLARNFRDRFGEIDIIVCNDDFLVFSEVKLRKDDSMVRPLEAVDYFKQQKIMKTAQHWLLLHQTLLQPRFDVVEVVHKNSVVISVKKIENAFGC